MYYPLYYSLKKQNYFLLKLNQKSNQIKSNQPEADISLEWKMSVWAISVETYKQLKQGFMTEGI